MGIDDIIVEGKELKEVFDKKELQSKYNLCCRKVRICMKEEGFTEQEQEKVNVKMHYLENEYSENDALISLKKSLGDTIEILEETLNSETEQEVQDTARSVKALMSFSS